MAKILSGFSSYKQQQETQAGRFMGGDFIRYLRLRDDGDMARIRFVSEHEPGLEGENGLQSYIISAQFHRTEEISKAGQRIYPIVICPKEEDDAGNLFGDCHHCKEENRRMLQFLTWAYVYNIYHRKQNTDDSNLWERTVDGETGSRTMFREPINKFLVLQGGANISMVLQGRIDKYGVLTDRVYDYTRNGARNLTTVSYVLDGDDPSAFDAELVEQANTLPDLIDVATGRVRTMGGEPFVNTTTGEITVDNHTPLVADDLPF